MPADKRYLHVSLGCLTVLYWHSNCTCSRTNYSSYQFHHHETYPIKIPLVETTWGNPRRAGVGCYCGDEKTENSFKVHVQYVCVCVCVHALWPRWDFGCPHQILREAVSPPASSYPSSRSLLALAQNLHLHFVCVCAGYVPRHVCL